MFKYLTFLLILILTLSSCHGCTFIKEQLFDRFTKKPQAQYQDQQEQETQEAPKKDSGPIPVNPQHS